MSALRPVRDQRRALQWPTLPCLLVALLAWIAQAPAFAMTGDAPEFRRLASDVYAYVGKRNEANAMAIVTTEGIVLVDTGHSPPETRNFAREISRITSQAVRYVIVTQNHGDHLGGAPFFVPGATLIVQEKIAEALSTMKPYQVKAWRTRFPERSDALKDKGPLTQVMSFSSRLSLNLGGKRIELFHVPDPFNDGDAAVWLPDAKILHAGFVGYKDRHPDLRPDFSHGTSQGMLKQLEAMIALRPQIVVPGHGPLASLQDLLVEVDYVLAARAKIRAMIERSEPLDVIRKTFSMSEYAGWDLPDHFPIIAETIYREMLGLGPQRPAIEEREVSGTIRQTAELGRFLEVEAEREGPLKLRISNETVVEGIANRALLKPGMRFSGTIQKPEGVTPPLGFLLMEINVFRD